MSAWWFSMVLKVENNCKVQKSPQGASVVLLEKNPANSMGTKGNKCNTAQRIRINNINDEVPRRQKRLGHFFLCTNKNDNKFCCLKMEPFRPGLEVGTLKRHGDER